MTAATDGGAATITLSASCASSSMVVESGEEASTMRTFAGRRCRKSSRRRGPSVSECDHLAAAASVGAIELVSDRPTQPVGEAPEVCVARVGLYVR